MSTEACPSSRANLAPRLLTSTTRPRARAAILTFDPSENASSDSAVWGARIYPPEGGSWLSTR